MIRSSALLSSPLAASAGATTAAQQQPSLPARFQGEWSSELKHYETSLDELTSDDQRRYDALLREPRFHQGYRHARVISA